MDDFDKKLQPLSLQGFVEFSNAVSQLQQAKKEQKVYKYEPNIFMSKE